VRAVFLRGKPDKMRAPVFMNFFPLEG